MACSSARVPPNTRCVWQSIRPGVTQAPPSATTSFARKPASSVRLPTRRILPSARSRSHMCIALGERCCYGQKVSGWPNLSDLVVGVETVAPVGLVGAPLAAGSVTTGQCDLAPALLRQTLRRIGRYDVETRRELSTKVTDRGDAEIAGLSIAEATGPISDAVRY